MKKPATHIGTCQACGNVQKLPNGVLSNHGYTKEWGFFSGTCPGAKRAPLEESCAYVKECIENAQLTIEDIRKQVEEVRQSVSPTVTIQVFVGRKAGGWIWVKGEVNFETKLVSYSVSGQEKSLSLYDLSASQGTKEEIVKKINGRFAESLEKNIVNFERYIEWQQKRIANWAPRELKPV